MNIGIVTTWFERGAAYVSKQYKDSLEECGHKVFIYSRGGEKHLKKDKKWQGDDIHEGKNSVSWKSYILTLTIFHFGLMLTMLK